MPGSTPSLHPTIAASRPDATAAWRLDQVYARFRPIADIAPDCAVDSARSTHLTLESCVMSSCRIRRSSMMAGAVS